MQYEERFSKRLIQLRVQKGVSAREMSLSIGQNASYINNIETGKALPSMNGFFYICEYLNISPQEFFNETAEAPQKVRELAEKASALPQQQIEHLAALANDLLENLK